MVLSTKNWIRFTRIDNLIPFTLLCPSQNNGLCDRYSRNHLQGLYFLLHLILSFYLAFLDIANTDTTASALKNEQPVIDSSQSPNPRMTGLHVFISNVDILAASNHFFILAFLDMSTTKVTSTTLPPVHKTFCEVRGRSEYDRSTAVFVSQDARPLKKRTSRNSTETIFRGSPPVQATLDGFKGCWKKAQHLHQRIHHQNGPISYVFVRDKQAVEYPNVLVSEKRGARRVLAPVSSCNQLFMRVFFEIFTRFFS